MKKMIYTLLGRRGVGGCFWVCWPPPTHRTESPLILNYCPRSFFFEEFWQIAHLFPNSGDATNILLFF